MAITVGFGSIGCGTLTSASITAAGEIDRYSFAGQAGHIVSLALASTGGFSTNPTASTSVELTVFAPSGAAVGTIRSNSQANLTLTETGIYVIRVRAANLTRTGSYNLNFECIVPPSPDAVPLACGTLRVEPDRSRRARSICSRSRDCRADHRAGAGQHGRVLGE